MSDTPNVPQVPPAAPAPAYPPPPPVSAPAQQYGAPAQQYGAPAQQYGAPAQQYGAPAPAPKKRRVWLWVLIIVLLLGCCGAAAVAAVVGGLVATGADQASTVAKADESFNKAVKVLTGIGDGFDAIGGADADPAAVQKFANESKSALDGARADLATSLKTIETLGDSEARTTYVSALEEADKGLEAIRGMLEDLTGKTALLAAVDGASASYKQANDKMNAAVTSLNGDKWKPAADTAAAAKTLFTQSRDGYLKAQGMDATAGMDKAVAYVDVQIQRATTVTQMANQGSRGNITDYNRLVKEFNALNTKIDAMPEPEAITDPDWATARLETLRTTAVDSLTKADELMTKAHTLFSGE
jgi:hypothetical protein